MVECDIFGNIKKSKKNNGVKIKVETNEYQDEERNKTKACWTIVSSLIISMSIMERKLTNANFVLLVLHVWGNMPSMKDVTLKVALNGQPNILFPDDHNKFVQWFKYSPLSYLNSNSIVTIFSNFRSCWNSLCSCTNFWQNAIRRRK